MLINNFFSLQLYILGAGWVSQKKLINCAYYISYAIKYNINIIFLKKTISQIKKTLVIIKAIKIYKGTVLFLSTNYKYQKNLNFFCASIQNIMLSNYYKGYFSNYLYKTKLQLIPDLIITFNISTTQRLLLEIRQVGIPTISLVQNYKLYHLIEYPIIINDTNYFINYVILHFYSKYLFNI